MTLSDAGIGAGAAMAARAPTADGSPTARRSRHRGGACSACAWKGPEPGVHRGPGLHRGGRAERAAGGDLLAWPLGSARRPATGRCEGCPVRGGRAAGEDRFESGTRGVPLAQLTSGARPLSLSPWHPLGVRTRTSRPSRSAPPPHAALAPPPLSLSLAREARTRRAARGRRAGRWRAREKVRRRRPGPYRRTGGRRGAPRRARAAPPAARGPRAARHHPVSAARARARAL